MSGQTQGKLPYPTGTDLVRDGDNAIKALAEAADAVTMRAVRLTKDGIAGATWASVVGPAVGPMPAGLYLCQAHLFWTYGAVGSGYTYAKFSLNGVIMAGSGTPVGGWTRDGDAPIHHAWTEFASHPGGTMTLSLEAGFSDIAIYVHSGCWIGAVRLGPLP